MESRGLPESTRLQAHFDTVATGNGGGKSYEEFRWKSDLRREAQREATAAFMRGKVVPDLGNAKYVVELGPGPGTWTRLIADALPDATFTLLDISPEMLARATEVFDRTNAVETRVGDFITVNLPEKADYFFSSRALEYVSDKHEAALRIACILSQNGRGTIITKMPKRIINRLMNRTPGPLHRGQIRPHELTHELAVAGLRIRGIYPVTFAIPFIHSASADRMAMRAFGLRPLSFFSSLFAESYAVAFEKP